MYRPVQFILNPDTIGIDVVTHYSQIILSKKFEQFDYGSVTNLIVYGSITPPEYNLTNISVKVALYVGANDWLATAEVSKF